MAGYTLTADCGMVIVGRAGTLDEAETEAKLKLWQHRSVCADCHPVEPSTPWVDDRPLLEQAAAALEDEGFDHLAQAVRDAAAALSEKTHG